MSNVISCDEAGNTGAALLDRTQPVFALASTNYTSDEATALLVALAPEGSAEPKFSKLRRSARGKDRLVEFFQQPQLKPDRVITTLDHKEYFVIGKLVDLIVEPMAHQDGLDLYERGANIALANLHFYATRAFCDSERFDAFLISFVTMVRLQDCESVDRFYYWANRLYDSCRDDHKPMLAPFLASKRIIRRILDGINYRDLDPAIPSFISHCVEWGNRFDQPFDVVHDQSKPLYAERDVLASFMDQSVQRVKIGYDRRKFSFPLLARSISFADSRQVPQLQVADIIAGATMALGATKAKMMYADIAGRLREAGVERFLRDAIWPSAAVTPAELGTDEVGGINAVDHVADFLMTRTRRPT